MEMPRKSFRQQKVYQPAHQLYECVCQVLSPCTFCNTFPQFPFHSSAMTGCSEASHFFSSMTPIVLIEAITSPCKPCLHGILRSSWSKHLYHFPPLHTRLANAFPSCRCLPTCLPGDCQQPWAAAFSASTFCRLTPCIICCHISLLNSPWKGSDVQPFSQNCMQESSPIPAVSNFPAILPCFPPDFTRSLGGCHMPRGKQAGCGL